MVGKVRRKVQVACDLTHDFSRLQADLLQGNQQSMLKEKTRLLNPPPITDCPQVLEDDPMLKKGKVFKPPPPFLGNLSPVTAPCWCDQSFLVRIESLLRLAEIAPCLNKLRLRNNTRLHECVGVH